MLSEGYGFNPETNITAASVVNSQKVGWALGASLYEINALPWTLSATDTARTFSWMAVGANLVLLGCCVVLSYHVFVARNHRGMSVWTGPTGGGYGAVDGVDKDFS